jgi:parallel beta-helix repeat protein
MSWIVTEYRSRLLQLFTVLTCFTLAGSISLSAAVCKVCLAPGATDVQIQKALDTIPAYGEVVLQPGTYQISQPLMLRRSYVTLSGSGNSTILHLANHANCPVVVLGPPMTQKKNRAEHLCLANLVIDGNRANQKVELWRWAADGSEFNNNGIQIWNVTDASVEHVTCKRCRSGGLVTAEVRRLVVNDFDSYDNQFDGLACYETEESRFDNLHLHDNLAAGISLDLSFNHNFITNAVLEDNDLGIFMRDSRGNSFQRLLISKCRHHGVFMAQTFASSPKGMLPCPDTQCVGNDFENLTVNGCGGKAFQVNDATCTDNSILGANFKGNLLGGLGQPKVNLVKFQEVAAR